MNYMPQGENAVDPIKLDKLAEVAVKVGLQLKSGQDLVITAPVVALPLVRQITKHAYMAGAGLVSAFYSDEESTLARYQYGNDQSFDRASNWLYEGMAKAYENGAARLAVAGDNPMMLSEQDPSKVSRANRATSAAYKPALEKISNFDINWNIVSYPNPAWAKLVFPERSRADRGCQARQGDLRRLARRCRRSDRGLGRAQCQSCQALRLAERPALFGAAFPGTGHRSQGRAGRWPRMAWRRLDGQERDHLQSEHSDRRGVHHAACLRVEGHVSSTKPLSHQGTLIDNIRVRFEGGRIVEAKASRGEEVLNKVLDTDEGARRLGEVALVPHSSPISASGILFYNTLFDENASCHIALGQCYSKCFLDGAKLSQEQIKAQGGNSSLIHIDWMIGSDKVDIDGIKPDGSRVPVMRQGEWA
jgi:aminopeptidase